MKTMLVCSERKINSHVGEFYDDIFEVSDSPTTDDIQDIANETRQRIRDLWKQDVADTERDGEPVVQVHLDGPSPYNAMLIDFQIVMAKAENIKVELPYLATAERTTEDTETNDVIRKLEEREGMTNNAKE